MIVRLCRKGLLRLGSEQETLIDALRDREHSPVIKDCLDRCGRCETGALIATADGMPLSAADAAELLTQVDALAEE